MKLQADINGVLGPVEIVCDGRAVTASVEDREYSLDVSEPEPGVYLIKHGNRVYEAAVGTKTGGAFTVRLHGLEHLVSIIDPKRLRGGGSSVGDASGKVELRTAMPGKVVRIVVAQGDAVKKGDSVIVVEAMKMQNEMKSPKHGIVSEIRAADGDTVGAGDVLVVIE